jgi:hypothetical protein
MNKPQFILVLLYILVPHITYELSFRACSGTGLEKTSVACDLILALARTRSQLRSKKRFVSPEHLLYLK